MRSRTMLALGALAVALVGAPRPAPAFHDPGYPMIFDHAFSGNAWVAQKVVVPSTPNRLGLEAQGVGAQAKISGVGVWLLNEDGSLRSFLLATSQSGAATERHVETLATGVVLHESTGGSGGLTGGASDMTDVPPGTYIAVLMAANDGALTDGHLRIYGEGGVALSGAPRAGTGAFVFHEPDFHGVANVYAAQPGVGRAKVLLGTSIERTIGARLFGWFGASAFDPVTVMTYDGPESGIGDTVFSGSPGGTYSFDVVANAGAGFAGLWLWGADVALP